MAYTVMESWRPIKRMLLVIEVRKDRGFQRTNDKPAIERSETTCALPLLSVRGPRSVIGRPAVPTASPAPDRAGTGREAVRSGG